MNKFIGIYSLFLQEDLFIECQKYSWKIFNDGELSRPCYL